MRTMDIKLYDKVRLKDGRTASVVEILKEGAEYIVDIDVAEDDWETQEISAADIESVIC